MVFFCVMLGFVTSAVVIFGREVEELATFYRGSIWCIRLLFGDIEFDEMREAGRFLAGAWLIVFMIFVALILLNMLLAIVMDSYSVIKEQCLESEAVWHQLSMMLKHIQGHHVPLPVVMRALNAEIPEHLVRKAEEYLSEEDEEERIEFERKPITVEDLVESVGKPQHSGVTLSSLLCGSAPRRYAMDPKQAREILTAAVDAYYSEWAPSAADFDFMNMAEKITERTQRIHQMHKTISGREVHTDDPFADEDGEDNGMGMSHLLTEESNAPSREGTADDAHIDVRQTMTSLRGDFVSFMQDFRSDREQAVTEIARLTAEVDALRDRLAESGAAVPDLEMLLLAEEKASDVGSPPRSPRKSTGRLARLQDIEDDGSDDLPSVGGDTTPPMSPRVAITDKDAHVGIPDPLPPSMPKAVAPSTLALPASNFLGNVPSGDASQTSYVSVMQSHKLLPSNFKAPSDFSKESPDWPDEISMPASTPPGSRAGSSQGDKPKKAQSSGSSSRDKDDFIINLYDLDLDDDSMSNLSEDRSASDGEFVEERPVGIAPGSGLPKVHATRVADGVGFGSITASALGEAGQQSHEDFEFTNFKDAQSQLRNMLSKHKPGTRSRADHPGTDEI
jgi:hypothetical protein